MDSDVTSVQRGMPPIKMVVALGLLLGDFLLLGLLLNALGQAATTYAPGVTWTEMGVVGMEFLAGGILTWIAIRPIERSHRVYWFLWHTLPAGILGIPPSSLITPHGIREGWWEVQGGIGGIPHLLSYPQIQVIAVVWFAIAVGKLVWIPLGIQRRG